MLFYNSCFQNYLSKKYGNKLHNSFKNTYILFKYLRNSALNWQILKSPVLDKKLHIKLGLSLVSVLMEISFDIFISISITFQHTQFSAIFVKS